MSALATYFALFIAGKKLNILIARFLIHSNYTLEQVPNFDRSIEQKSWWSPTLSAELDF